VGEGIDAQFAAARARATREPAFVCRIGQPSHNRLCRPAMPYPITLQAKPGGFPACDPGQAAVCRLPSLMAFTRQQGTTA